MVDVFTQAKPLQAILQQAKSHNQTIGFVPTMGALHQGHGQLIQQAKQENDLCVVSIFVNPKQFAAHEDLTTYPRTIEQDTEFLKAHNVDYLFLPQPKEIYPDDFITHISLQGFLTETLEAEHRPHFFNGVATIVLKLFNCVMPHKAYFGEKDFQQLCVIQQMTKDLSLPIHIQPIATMRDANGLALSSRNQYLSSDQYKIAITLNKTLLDVKHHINHAMPIQDALNKGTSQLLEHGFSKIDYLTIRDSSSLNNLTDSILRHSHYRILVAAYLDKIRLIDNI